MIFICLNIFFNLDQSFKSLNNTVDRLFDLRNIIFIVRYVVKLLIFYNSYFSNKLSFELFKYAIWSVLLHSLKVVKIFKSSTKDKLCIQGNICVRFIFAIFVSGRIKNIFFKLLYYLSNTVSVFISLSL